MLSYINKKKSSKLKYLTIFSFGIVFAILFNIGLEYTNTTEFCTSCHSMQTNLAELKESPHWLNRSGVSASCADCHVPKPLLAKLTSKIYAVKDVWYEMLGTIDTKEKYEKHRWAMANTVWQKMRETDSRECRNCHQYEHMDFSQQDRSARKKHGNVDDTGKTCIDCHKGLVHEEPDEPDDVEEVEEKKDS